MTKIHFITKLFYKSEVFSQFLFLKELIQEFEVLKLVEFYSVDDISNHVNIFSHF